MKMTNRKIALMDGSKRYQGKPCKNCNGTERLVASRGCVTCSIKHSMGWFAKNPERKLIHSDRYYNKNKEQIIKKVVRYHRKRVQTNLNYKISVYLGTRVYNAIKSGKAGSAVRDLGCSIEEFKQHVASQFISGMTWENYGKWHLDHIKPLSSFDLTKREQFLVAAHYTNIQPLWARDNIVKGNKYPQNDFRCIALGT